MASVTLGPASLSGNLRTLHVCLKKHIVSFAHCNFSLAPPVLRSLSTCRIYSQQKYSSAHGPVMPYTTVSLQKSKLLKHGAFCKRIVVLSKRDKRSQFRIDDFVEHSARPKKEFDQKAATRSFYEDSDKYLTADNFLTTYCSESKTNKDLDTMLAIVSDNKDVSPEMLAESLSALARQPKKKVSKLVQSGKLDPHLTMVLNCSKDFTDKDFVAVLVSLYTFKIPYWHQVYKALISECERRVYSWDISTMLVVSDTWRAINRIVTEYNNRMLELIEPQYLDLTHHQLVQLLYVIGENRTSPLTLMKKLEDVVLSYIDELTGKEIAAVCLGYFKSQTIISSAALLQVLGDRALERFDQLDVFSVISIFKALRHATTVHLPLFKKAAATFSPVLQDQLLVAVMNLVFTYAALHVFDKDLLDAVAEKAVRDVKQCRIKDIAKFLWTFGQLNYRPANSDLFLNTMIKELRAHSHEFPRWPEHLVYSLVALAYLDTFPYDLINTVFSPAMLKHIKGCTMYTRTPIWLKPCPEYCPWETLRDLYVVDGAVGVECEDYTGHRLSQEFIKQLPEGGKGSVKHELAHRENLAEVLRMLEQMLGRDRCRVCLVLPHFKSADIEIHLDQTNQAVVMDGPDFVPRGQKKQADIKLNKNLIDILTGTKTDSEESPGEKEEAVTEVANKDTENITRLAVQVTSFKHHHYNSHTLLGVHEMKRRQLRKLGYRVVEIPYYEWLELPRHPDTERKDYLSKKIFGQK